MIPRRIVTKNSKHIEVHYHFVNENYLNGIIDMVKIESENNVADIIIKSLDKLKFVKFKEMLSIKIRFMEVHARYEK